MRIISGIYGGRKLQTVKGQSIRPTSDKVRGAIFNALRSRGVLEGARVLDCFCGTGALGLEALSQGAAQCMFIDKSKTSLEVAKENAASLGVGEEAEFILKDVTKLGQRPESQPPADLVFLDPPYGEDLLIPSLSILHDSNRVKQGAIIVAEVEKGFSQAVSPPYEIIDEKIYKDTKILTLRYGTSP